MAKTVPTCSSGKTKPALKLPNVNRGHSKLASMLIKKFVTKK